VSRALPGEGAAPEVGLAERHRRVAATFTDRVVRVPDGGWELPAPCEGWVARDVVRHLVDWLPGLFFDGWGVARPTGPSVDEDPVGAWAAVDVALQARLDDPQQAAAEADAAGGRLRLDEAVARFATPDVLVHTWDLARATGQDETLDPDKCAEMLDGMRPMEAALRGSGHYGPAVEVPEDADVQTQLLAFIGRTP
jgi:uncharacterized protein (TIGR03086 family)